MEFPVLDVDGTALDAKWVLVSPTKWRLLAAGGTRNRQYNRAFEALMSHALLLCLELDAVILDSTVAHQRLGTSEELRVIPVSIPSPFRSEDIREFRTNVQNTMATMARRPDAREGGGNPQKNSFFRFRAREFEWCSSHLGWNHQIKPLYLRLNEFVQGPSRFSVDDTYQDFQPVILPLFEC